MSYDRSFVPPRPEHLPKELADLATEYQAIQEPLAAAITTRGTLSEPMALYAAEQADAAELAAAVRAGKDPRTVGTPNVTKLKADLAEATAQAAALTAARDAIEDQLRDLMAMHAATGIEHATETAEQLHASYAAAIDAVEAAARAFDATLHVLGGWHTYVGSRDGRIAFGTYGSVTVAGRTLDPVPLTQLTGTLREHSRRHRLIIDAIEKARLAKVAAG